MNLGVQTFEPDEWGTFCTVRNNYLHALAEVVEQSLLRQDTDHPVFCGCIDWHSSVHGCYALLVASRLTGESRWAEVVRSILDPGLLKEELDDLQSGGLDHEMPYGYAWFLKLTQEFAKSHEEALLAPLVSEIASRLETWLFSLSSSEIRQRVHDRKYDNLSWPILNLWEWSRGKADHMLTEKIRHFVERYLVPPDKEEILKADAHEDEFFSSSLQRIRAILAVLPDMISRHWFVAALEEEEKVLPLTHASFPHAGGLNFSRSWALWDVYQKTGKKKFLELYISHIVTHMELPQFWRDDYRKYSHWVPQFGIYAIALSMDSSSRVLAPSMTSVT